MILGLIFLAACLYLLRQWLSMRPRNFPPGPMHLPLVGCALSVPYKHPHLTMESWREKYGSVVGLLLGPRVKAIAVCEPQAVFEVLRREEFQNRPDGKAFRERTLNKRLGILFTDGSYWEKHRYFSIKHLKELGFGKKSMERVILDEVEDLITDIRDKTMQVADLFSCRVLNVLWSITAGDRFSPKDEQLTELLKGVNITFRSSTSIGPFLSRIFPFLKKLAPQLVGYTKEIEARHKIQDFIREVIHTHTSTIDIENPRDFIDVYLTEVQSGKDPDFTEDGLLGLLFDLFGAGAEPISNTLAFALLYLILHPDVQQKLQQQIDMVVGKSSRISLDHRSQLPYLEAVIAEVFRINTIAPLGTPHSVAKDTVLNGYSVPKGALVLISFWSVLQDSKHWGDPNIFRPERFIDPNTGNFVKDPWLINFGMGKRICVGETLARSNLFLFLGSLIQEFEISSRGTVPSTEAQTGFLTAPKPFEILFKSRT